MTAALSGEISGCRLCAGRFAATATGHRPRPVVWFRQGARILVAGQAPGMRVHQSGRPFTDASGDRLRDWMGVGEDIFYDRRRIAVVPMAFCFPGYDANGSDLPPPKLCAETWHGRVMGSLGRIELTILVGGYAHRWHLGAKQSVTEVVAAWRDHAPSVFALPHPSWRNTAWMKRNPWFADEVVPELRARVRAVLENR
ncbi:MAG: uracil-DNA glycosylase family protein [Pseudomonadota bacterium]